MKSFNSQLKKFCQLTIKLIDLREARAKKIEKDDFSKVLDFQKKENKVIGKIFIIVNKIYSQFNSIELNSENMFEAQKMSWFLSQFTGANTPFKIAVFQKIEKLKIEIEEETKNENHLKAIELKNEMKKLDENSYKISNWYLN